MNLDHVLYIPRLLTKVNLFSIPVVVDHGCYSLFGPNKLLITNMDKKVMAEGSKIGRSWWLDCDIKSHEICLEMKVSSEICLEMKVSNESTATIDTWHQRMGHLNKRDVKRLEELSTDMTIGTPPAHDSLKCTRCLLGKDHRQISRAKRKEPSRPLEVVFFDICGAMVTAGIFRDYLYFCVIMDGKTCFTWVYCLKKKKDARQALVKWKAISENFSNCRLL